MVPFVSVGVEGINLKDSLGKLVTMVSFTRRTPPVC